MSTVRLFQSLIPLAIIPIAFTATDLLALEQVNTTEACLIDALRTAEPETTVEAIRAQCTEQVSPTQASATAATDKQLTPMQNRIADEHENYDHPFAITAFKPNYLIATYSKDPNPSTLNSGGGNNLLDNEEAQFQISIKAPVWRNMFGSNNDIMAAYTSVSWWQIRNDRISSAFRETNYEPELYFSHRGGPSLFGGTVAAFNIGINHQSNGRSQLLSRSWDRIMGRLYLDFNSVAVELRAWYRLPEDDEEDNNPNMYRYYGAGDIRVAYAPNKNTFTAMFRPGTQKNGLELTWSYPMTKSLRVYAQYWNGYGESLLDYDARIQRIGIGVSLNDYIQR
ncbi:MAG: phospholipase A [Chromatiales bacterium]|nr:phospholipase A [Chromatiales bacterium]